MPTFTSLSQSSQDLIMVQFEFIGKVFLLGCFLLFAIANIFYFKRSQKETPYFLVAFVRTILYFLSWVYLFFSPLFIVYLYPQISIEKILSATFIIYALSFFVIGTVFLINILWYGPMVLVRIGGLDIGSKNTSKVMDDFLGKYKKHFKRT